MIRALRLAAALLSLLPVAASAQDASARFAAVRDTIRAVMQSAGFPSISVAVAQGTNIVWEESFGFADRERQIAATTRTMYSLASISKPFTATALMTLVERGQVDLDRPANTYLGAAALRAFEGNAADATVRRVLTHTAGLPLHYQFFYDGVAKVESNDDAIAHYGILVYPPGETFFYSNLGYGILGHIVSRVSGRGYEAYLREQVLAPLGLSNSDVSTGKGLGKKAAVRYDNDLKPLLPYAFDHTAASGVWSSANDLVRFGMFHLGNTLRGQQQILKPETIERMQRSDAPADVPGQSRGWGWAIAEDDNGYRRVAHTGSMPGVSTILNLYPSEKLAIVVLANRNNGAALARVSAAIAAVMLPQYAANRDARRAQPRPPVAARFTPSAELVGAWRGRLLVERDTISLVLDVHPDGDVHVRFGDQLETVLSGATMTGVWLTGRFQAPLRAPDAVPIADQQRIFVSLNLRPRGDRLTGWASAISTAVLNYGAVSYRAELQKATSAR